MHRILVTGANGQLGSEIRLLAEKHSNFEFVFTDIDNFPLENTAKIVSNFNKISPDLVINCAAYTAVDKAEQEHELADAVNHLAIATLAKLCFESKSKLIHISTDYVFDGSSSIAYTEDDLPNPKNIYGLTKLAGEHACLSNCPDSIIIRTAWVYSEFGNNFVKTMLRLMTERESLNVVNDQIGSPTYAADLAEAILKIIASNNWQSGIYHYSNVGDISWHRFALDIKEIAGLHCQVSGIPTSAYPTAASRPSFSLLDKSKIKKVFGIEPVDYKISLTKMMSRLGHGI